LKPVLENAQVHTDGFSRLFLDKLLPNLLLMIEILVKDQIDRQTKEADGDECASQEGVS
jgi:hypothetical protein